MPDRLTVRLDPELSAELEETMAYTGRSASEEMRVAIRAHIMGVLASKRRRAAGFKPVPEESA